MNVGKKLVLALLIGSTCAQNIRADESEELAMNIAKGTAGAVIGGGLGYWLSQFCQSQLVEEHALKIKFLDDLTLFIQSEHYEQGESSRLFTHYYNALNQLVQSTRSIEIDLLHEFADCRSEIARQVLLHKIENIQTQLQASHEHDIKMGKYLLAAFGALLGGVLPFAGHEHEHSASCGHKHYHSTTYVSSFARSIPGNIFSRR